MLRYLALLLLVCPLVLRAGKPAAPADYQGAIVIDATSGAILAEDKPDFQGPPASVTKLMTFLVVYEAIAAGQISYATPVTITQDDADMGGTQVWLEAGETYTVEELTYALMIQSANDAAHALARTAGGSREAFVARMNERARALGLSRTTWRTPHGLPPASRTLAESDQTTPRDLAMLSRELLRHTDIVRFTSAQVRKFGEGQRPVATVVEMRTHNKLLGSVTGCDGLKTGYTAGAGFCLAATAERDGRRLIVVVMGSPSAKVRDKHVRRMLEENFPKIPAESRWAGSTAPAAIAPLVLAPDNSSSKPSPTPQEEPTVKFKL
jgi:D-alanyl-D-alanine carboxypeptidase